MTLLLFHSNLQSLHCLALQIVTTFPGIIWPGSRVNFPENVHVQVYESYYTYDGLSMVAEIGGYVGLFLGISVNQVGMLLQKLFLYYQQ